MTESERLETGWGGGGGWRFQGSMSRVHLWMDGVANVWSKALSNCTAERRTIAGLMRCWLVWVMRRRSNGRLNKGGDLLKALELYCSGLCYTRQYNMWTNKSYGIVVGGRHEYRIENKNGHWGTGLMWTCPLNFTRSTPFHRPLIINIVSTRTSSSSSCCERLQNSSSAYYNGISSQQTKTQALKYLWIGTGT